MYVKTTIRSESEGVQLSAYLTPEGKYDSPQITFYNIEGEYLTSLDYVTQIWDNSVYLVDDLYPEIVQCIKMGIPCEDKELLSLLDKAQCGIVELKDMLTRALQLNFFELVDSELLKSE